MTTGFTGFSWSVPGSVATMSRRCLGTVRGRFNLGSTTLSEVGLPVWRSTLGPVAPRKSTTQSGKRSAETFVARPESVEDAFTEIPHNRLGEPRDIYAVVYVVRDGKSSSGKLQLCAWGSISSTVMPGSWSG